MERFWIVWEDRGGGPTHKHHTLASAKKEAERLARDNPHTHFHVLELVCSAILSVPIEWTDADDIPF